MQYSSQTKDEFRYRWDSYKNNNWKSLRREDQKKGEDHNQAGFFSHFQAAGHSGFINVTKVTFIYKTNPFTGRENFWIDTFKTPFPQGLNNIDSYH